MKRTSIIILLISANFFLAFKLIHSVQKEIKYQERIKAAEFNIISKLIFIRDLQVVFKSQKGRYAKTWEELGLFARKDTIFIVQTKELPVLDETDMVRIVKIAKDTLGQISVSDSIFSKSPYSERELSRIPGYKDYHFKLKTATTTFGGVNIEVIEVSSPISVEGRPHLKFGSLASPTLAGNW